MVVVVVGWGVGWGAEVRLCVAVQATVALERAGLPMGMKVG